MSDAIRPAFGSGIPDQDVAAPRGAPVEPGGDVGSVVPTDPIGVNRPLLIRIHRIFTGDKNAGQVLITSAVKSS